MAKIQNFILGLLFICGGSGIPLLYGMESLVLEDQQIKECSCCNNKLKSQDDQLFTLECKHSYHADCLKEYLDPNSDPNSNSDNQNKCRLCEEPISADFIRNNNLYKAGIIEKNIKCYLCRDKVNKICRLACSHESCVSCINRHIAAKNDTYKAELDCPQCLKEIPIDFIKKYLNPNFVRNLNLHPEEDPDILQAHIERIQGENNDDDVGEGVGFWGNPEEIGIGGMIDIGIGEMIDISVLRELFADMHVVQLNEGNHPLHPAAEPMRNGIDHLHPAAEPMGNEVDHLHPAAVPMGNGVDHLHPAAVPMGNRVDHLHPAAEPMGNGIDHLHPAAEPMGNGIDHLHSAAEPMGNGIDHLHSAAEPMGNRVDHLHPAAEPMRNGVDHLRQDQIRSRHNLKDWLGVTCFAGLLGGCIYILLGEAGLVNSVSYWSGKKTGKALFKNFEMAARRESSDGLSTILLSMLQKAGLTVFSQNSWDTYGWYYSTLESRPKDHIRGIKEGIMQKPLFDLLAREKLPKETRDEFKHIYNKVITLIERVETALKTDNFTRDRSTDNAYMTTAHGHT